MSECAPAHRARAAGPVPMMTPMGPACESSGASRTPASERRADARQGVTPGTQGSAGSQALADVGIRLSCLLRRKQRRRHAAVPKRAGAVKDISRGRTSKEGDHVPSSNALAFPRLIWAPPALRGPRAGTIVAAGDNALGAAAGDQVAPAVARGGTSLVAWSDRRSIRRTRAASSSSKHPPTSMRRTCGR
jgi:hypothetical protein